MRTPRGGFNIGISKEDTCGPEKSSKNQQQAHNLLKQWKDKGGIYSRKATKNKSKGKAGQRWSMSLFLVVAEGEAGRFL